MTADAAPLLPVGVFGGTFNPIHYGHLRSALELAEHLQLQQVRLLPSATPPHRPPPGCHAGHRANMVELAVASEPRLLCDRRELQRAGPSYTIDSLVELRAELGSGHSLCLVMGCDALIDLAGWHRWRELLEWAHIAIIARPGWQLPHTGPVADWLAAAVPGSAETLRRQAEGSVIVEELRPLAISATEIRELLAAGKSARYLLPEAVLDYIEDHGLYR